LRATVTPSSLTDKPGVGGSSGNWQLQTFEDRAKEVVAAMRFLRARKRHATVGLCGASQAGWIMPIVAASAPLAFIISISGSAVTVEEQEGYRIRRQLQVDGFSKREVERAVRTYRNVLLMIQKRDAVKNIAAMLNEAKQERRFDYLDLGTEEDIRFFAAIYRFDPLPFLRRVSCPFLGIWGRLDTNLPAAKSMRLTRRALVEARNPRFKLVLLPKVNHRMRLARSGSPHEKTLRITPRLWDTMATFLDWIDPS
jgi:pimeloyl-ACP methyl ester carboxylesterase